MKRWYLQLAAMAGLAMLAPDAAAGNRTFSIRATRQNRTLRVTQTRHSVLIQRQEHVAPFEVADLTVPGLKVSIQQAQPSAAVRLRIVAHDSFFVGALGALELTVEGDEPRVTEAYPIPGRLQVSDFTLAGLVNQSRALSQPTRWADHILEHGPLGVAGLEVAPRLVLITGDTIKNAPYLIDAHGGEQYEISWSAGD